MLTLLTFFDIYKFTEANRSKNVVAFHFIANNEVKTKLFSFIP